jgi:hypothetical protein
MMGQDKRRVRFLLKQDSINRLDAQYGLDGAWPQLCQK